MESSKFEGEISDKNKSSDELKPKSHDGHRQRMKSRFLNDGIDSLNEHEILELILYYTVPRKDTNEIAHNMIEEFGSLKNIFNASPNLLRKRKVSENLIVLLSLIKDINKKYFSDESDPLKDEFKIDDIRDALIMDFIGQTIESVIVVLVNSRGEQIHKQKMGKGSLNSSNLYMKDIVEVCTNKHAAGVILAHNHPSGVPLPSEKDIESTIELQKSLNSLRVRLCDHIIVAGTEYIAMSKFPGTKHIFDY